jgi:hypothetical protein
VRKLYAFTVLSFGVVCVPADGQVRVPAAPSPSPERQAERQRLEQVVTSYFARLGAGQIPVEHAPKRGVIVRTAGQFEKPSLEKYRDIFAHCEMRRFMPVTTSVGVDGPSETTYVTEWTCPEGAPDRAPTAAFALNGTDVDDLRVQFSGAGKRWAE